ARCWRVGPNSVRPGASAAGPYILLALGGMAILAMTSHGQDARATPPGGGSRLAVFHHQVQCSPGVHLQAGTGELGGAVRNLPPGLFENRIVEAKNSRARHASQQVLKIVAAHLLVGKQLG